MNLNKNIHIDTIIISILNVQRCKKIYLTNIPGFDSDDDEESQQIKYNQELQTAINKNNYKKTIYENDNWVKKSYKKRYLRDLRCLCPGIIKIINIYKNYLAWKRNLNLLEY